MRDPPVTFDETGIAAEQDRSGETVVAKPDQARRSQHAQCQQITGQRWKDAEHPPEVESAQADPAGGLPLPQQQGRDDEAADDEEQQHAGLGDRLRDAAGQAPDRALRGFEAIKDSVSEHHAGYGDCPEPVDGPVPAHHMAGHVGRCIMGQGSPVYRRWRHQSRVDGSDGIPLASRPMFGARHPGNAIVPKLVKRQRASPGLRRSQPYHGQDR